MDEYPWHILGKDPSRKARTHIYGLMQDTLELLLNKSLLLK